MLISQSLMSIIYIFEARIIYIFGAFPMGALFLKQFKLLWSQSGTAKSQKIMEVKVNNLIIKGTEKIKSLIYEIRGKQVMLDSDLARLYGV